MSYRCSNCGSTIDTEYSTGPYSSESSKFTPICPKCGVPFSNVQLICVNCEHTGPASEFVSGRGLTIGGVTRPNVCPKCRWDIQLVKDFRNAVCPQCHRNFPTLRGKTAGRLFGLNRWGWVLSLRNTSGRLSGYRCPYCKTRMYASGEKVDELKARAKKSIKLGITSVITSFLLLGVFFSIPGIIVALKCLRDKSYKGLAITGLVLSLIGIAIEVALIVLGMQSSHF